MIYSSLHVLLPLILTAVVKSNQFSFPFDKEKNEVPLNCYVTRTLLTIIQVLYLPLYAGKVTILERVVIDDPIPHMVVTRIK